EMVHSIYVKNLSEETFTLRFNTEFGGSTGIKIEPLEIKRLVVTGVGRKKYDFVQLHIFTNDHMNDIEFAFWREKLELGNKATDWSPALEDFETYDDYIMWFVNSGKFQLEKDGIYGLADDIHIDYQKYVFEENNFSVYNAGNVEIEPESMYINIIVSGLNGEIEIKNLTTGQLFKLEKPFKGILELKGMSTKMNGTNIFRDTNKRLINLAVGKNDFEVTGNFKDITFDFKYYYK